MLVTRESFKKLTCCGAFLLLDRGKNIHVIYDCCNEIVIDLLVKNEQRSSNRDLIRGMKRSSDFFVIIPGKGKNDA